MFSRNRLSAVILIVACAAGLAGCASYYQVTDLQSGTKYYTKDVDDEGSAVRFKDARTNSVVTVQNSQVRHISKDRYDDGMTER